MKFNAQNVRSDQSRDSFDWNYEKIQFLDPNVTSVPYFEFLSKVIKKYKKKVYFYLFFYSKVTRFDV